MKEKKKKHSNSSRSTSRIIYKEHRFPLAIDSAPTLPSLIGQLEPHRSGSAVSTPTQQGLGLSATIIVEWLGSAGWEGGPPSIWEYPYQHSINTNCSQGDDITMPDDESSALQEQARTRPLKG
ncbi:hypothetical protein GX48_00448 [Paracoccidioides brasiliensis]|nr:hypothetical protein GX48_00448 [Paracoccidioides brasiliensis]